MTGDRPYPEVRLVEMRTAEQRRKDQGSYHVGRQATWARQALEAPPRLTSSGTTEGGGGAGIGLTGPTGGAVGDR